VVDDTFGRVGYRRHYCFFGLVVVVVVVVTATAAVVGGERGK
jgi:hypothetical protein